MVHDHITVKPPEGAHKPKGIACAPQRNGKRKNLVMVTYIVIEGVFARIEKRKEKRKRKVTIFRSPDLHVFYSHCVKYNVNVSSWCIL